MVELRGPLHDEIAALLEAWEAGADQFGRIDGYEGKLSRLPAPRTAQRPAHPEETPDLTDPVAPEILTSLEACWPNR